MIESNKTTIKEKALKDLMVLKRLTGMNTVKSRDNLPPKLLQIIGAVKVFLHPKKNEKLGEMRWGCNLI